MQTSNFSCISFKRFKRIAKKNLVPKDHLASFINFKQILLSRQLSSKYRINKKMMLIFSKSFACTRQLQKPVRLLVRDWHKKPVPVTWEKPERGWTKLNFDGSCKCKTGSGSIGGVLRNHEAEFLLGYAEPIGRTNSTIAELVALQRGLELVLEYGWKDVWIEGDSKSLIQIIAQKRKVKCAEVQKYVVHINQIIPALDNCIMTHIYREGNRAADKFAKMGYHLKNPQIWHHNPPEEVMRIVHEDAQGKTHLRRR